MRTQVKKRILCVEDEHVLTEMYKDLLEKEGYEVDVAYNGVEALPMILTDNYDIITLDHLMPKMCGNEVMEKLQGVKLKGKIGMLTNLSDEKLIQQAINQGANFYMLLSCYDPTTFVEEINLIMNREEPYAVTAQPEADQKEIGKGTIQQVNLSS